MRGGGKNRKTSTLIRSNAHSTGSRGIGKKNKNKKKKEHEEEY